MEKSFDFGALLKNHTKNHKSKPMQFASVAGGVKKRLENNLKCRRSNRLTLFDSIRNLSESRCSSPAPPLKSEAQLKVERRRQQLEKWKEEKEKRKKELASQKKKPFVTGTVNNPSKFVPPPPLPKPVHRSSGRVTRSQTARNNKPCNPPHNNESKQSFAPKNAGFQAPKNLTEVPKLAPVKPKTKKSTVIFEPVLPVVDEVQLIRMRTYMKQSAKTVETRRARKPKPQQKATANYVSSSSSDNEHPTKTQSSSISENESNKQSSSTDDDMTKTIMFSSENESAKSLQSYPSSDLEREKSPLLNKSRKSLPARSSLASRSKTPQKSAKARRSLRVPSQSETLSFTPRNPVPKSESSSEEKLRSSKSPAELMMTPEQIAEEAKRMSPRVTLSRGKDNARKEMKKKLEQGLLDDDASDMDSVDHFRRQLASEIERLTNMCNTWEQIYQHLTLPEFVQERVLGAVGQARLLVSQKLAQFGALVQRCELPDPARPLVTPADLHGFWDMVFMQVENVDMRFKKLEELKARNWLEEEPVQAKRKPKVVKHVVKPKASAPSRIKEMIAAARKAKKEEHPVPPTYDKTFEAGFFCIRSPSRTPAGPSPAAASPATPRDTHNLLKAVLSSEAKKASASKQSASFAMLRASVLGRNVDCEGVAPLPPTPLSQVINLTATPGRSILKQNPDSTAKTGNRSIKMVLFNESDNEIDRSIHQMNEPETEINVDNGLSSMEIEKDSTQDKENTKVKPKLTRQEAVTSKDDFIEFSPVITRSRRKSMQTPQAEEKTQRRSGRKKKVLEESMNVLEEKKTPRRSMRSRKSCAQD